MNWNDDHIWDERQWEAYINEVEQKTELLRKLLESNTDTNIPRWLKLLRENLSEDEAVDAFIEEELSLEDVYYPDEEDDDWEDEDEFEDDFLFNRDLSDEELDDWQDDLDDWEDEGDDWDWLYDEDDFDEGEWWKANSDDYVDSDYGDIENLSIYTDAHELSVGALKWAQQIDESSKNPELKTFIDNLLQIGAKLAAGYSFGFEQDVLGANIVYTRKALSLANRSLEALTKLKQASFMEPAKYVYLHTHLHELRNDIGVYLQILRERFSLGLE
jgi:hypothetical protein